MITITTLTNSFILNGTQYNKGALIVSPTATGAKFGYLYAKLDEIEVDGVTYSTIEELHTALDTKLFKSGGGNGSGVAGLTWDDTSMMPVAGKVPVFSPQGLLSTGMPLFPENAVPLAYVDLILQRFIGVFDSEAALNTAHPTGAETQYAYVRDIDSTGDIFRYYYWNDMAEAWIPLNKKEDDLYSLNETNTGKIWHNGKSVYRRVFNDMDISDVSNIEVAFGESVSGVVSITYILTTDGKIYSQHSNLNVFTNQDYINIVMTNQFTTPTSITVIIEYTK